MGQADFSIVFNVATMQFGLTDISDWVSQSIALSNVKGNFKITSPSGVVIHENLLTTEVTGTASSGGTNSITLTGASSIDDIYNGYFVKITGGTGSGQVRPITDYNGTTKVATVVNLWTTAPDNTSTFQICLCDISLPESYTPITGTMQSSASDTTAVLQAGSSAVNDFYNSLYIKITGGTGSGQVRQVTDYVGSTLTITVDEQWDTSPDSTSTYAFNYGSFFFTATNLQQGDYPLPELTNGDVDPGVYTFEYNVYDSNLSTYYSKTKTFDFQIEFPEITSTQYVDCVTPLVSTTDTTDYTFDNVTPTVNRLHKLFFPAINGTEITPIVGSLTTITTSTLYAPTAYTDYIKANITFSYNDSVYVYNSISKSKIFTVDCPADLCNVFCVLNTTYNQWINLKCDNPTEAAKYLNKFIQASSVASLIAMASRCGKYLDIPGYAQQIRNITDTTNGCGCGCSDGEPKLIQGLGGTAQNVSVISSGTITVSSYTVGTTTVYVPTISSTILNTINNLTATSVSGTVSNTVTHSGNNYNVQGPAMTSADNSVTIATTGTPITNFDLSVNAKNVLENDWVVQNNGATTGSYVSLKPFTITNTAGTAATATLPTNKDELWTTHEFSQSSDLAVQQFYIKFLFNSATMFDVDFSKYNKVVIETKIVRITSTTVDIWVKILLLRSGNIISEARYATYLNKTANNFTTSNLGNVIDFQIKSSVASNAVYNHQQIDKFLK